MEWNTLNYLLEFHPWKNFLEVKEDETIVLRASRLVCSQGITRKNATRALQFLAECLKRVFENGPPHNCENVLARVADELMILWNQDTERLGKVLDTLCRRRPKVPSEKLDFLHQHAAFVASIVRDDLVDESLGKGKGTALHVGIRLGYEEFSHHLIHVKKANVAIRFKNMCCSGMAKMRQKKFSDPLMRLLRAGCLGCRFCRTCS